MIPISLKWNTQNRSFSIQWDGMMGSEYREGKTFIKILGSPLPIPIRRIRIEPSRRFLIRWVYLKGMFSFIKDWKIKKIEGAISFQDPMINGVFYGWASAVYSWNSDRKVCIHINFLGENWWRGEMIISPRLLFYHLKKWIFPMVREIKGKKTKRR